MPRTTIDGLQITDGSVSYTDLDAITIEEITTKVKKIISGDNIIVSSSGSGGTGDVTLSVPISAIGGVRSIIAGENVTISSTASGGTGNVTISASISAIRASSIACRVRLGATNQTIAGTTWTKIAFVNKDFDTTNSFNTTLSRYTAPISGYYHVDCAFQTGSNKETRIGIYLNGTETIRMCDQTDSVSFHQGSVVQYLGAGQYIEFWIWINASSTIVTGISCFASIAFVT